MFPANVPKPKIGARSNADVSTVISCSARLHANVSPDCGEHGHASEARCNPEKKAAYAAAQAAAAGDEDDGTNDFGNSGTTGGDEGWNQSGNDFSGSGQASWENSATPPTPAVTVGHGDW